MARVLILGPEHQAPSEKSVTDLVLRKGGKQLIRDTRAEKYQMRKYYVCASYVAGFRPNNVCRAAGREKAAHPLAHGAACGTHAAHLAEEGSDLIGLIITSPLLLGAAIAIKKNDGGKVLFKQKRATVHGKVFEIYKFRTMHENAGNYSVKDHDDRVTKPGRFLRKYRIDELPQLFNILKGDMSLVGPRPEMLENVEDYTRELPEFRYRLRMKAGLTGYAQIIGKYNTSSRDKLMLDLMYIENFSILRDIQLLFQTILVLFKAEDSTEAFHDED